MPTYDETGAAPTETRRSLEIWWLDGHVIHLSSHVPAASERVESLETFLLIGRNLVQEWIRAEFSGGGGSGAHGDMVWVVDVSH